MPYLHLKDFKAGLDTRRDQAVAQPGVLLVGDNIHINRGGEVEKRFAFSKVAQLPTGTFGMAATAYALWIFGDVPRPAELDPAFSYMRVSVEGKDVAEILDWEVFTGKVYVSVRYADNAVRHWYDGTIVADWTPPVETGVPSTAPVYAPLLTLAQKLYAGAGNTLFFSAVDDATIWTPGVPSAQGQGFKDLTNAASGSERLVSLASYQGRVAVFTRRSVQIHAVDPDPDNYRLLQTLLNLGTMAPRSVVNFGDSDVFFLADTGVRSLRARDSSNNASVSDIGTPVDDIVNEAVRNLPLLGREAVSVIEPVSGRYWLALGRTIFVFSYYPNGKVAAWSTYSLGFAPVAFATVGNRVYVRGDDGGLYVYGGASGQDYGDDYRCTVEPALLDGGKPATFKRVQGFDLSCQGSWRVWLGTDPSRIDARDHIGDVDRPTWGMERWAANGYGTHFSIRLTHQGAGPAKVNSLAVHYDEGEQD